MAVGREAYDMLRVPILWHVTLDTPTPTGER